MTAFLDWSFEHLVLLAIITTLLVLCLGLFWILPLFRRRSLLRFPMLLVVFVPFGFYWGALFSGRYGYSHTQSGFTTCGDVVCFLDKYQRVGRTSSYTDVRLYIVDAKTGNRLYRTYIGNSGDILASCKGQLFYSCDDAYYLLNPQTNSILKTFSKETLPKLYPQIASGVNEVRFLREEVSYAEELLKVVAKNGTTYFIDPFDGKIAEKQFAASCHTDPVATPGESITLPGSSDTAVRKIGFVKKEGSVGELLALYDDHHWTNAAGMNTLLFPAFLTANNKTKSLLILSYATTDKTGFLLTGINLQMKQLWQQKQEDLEGKTASGNELKHFTNYGTDVIFSLNDMFYSVNTATGAVNWKVVL